jgi:very-short-patch-repair endonuclease
MTVSAYAPSPTLPRKRERGQQRPRAMTALPTTSATLGSLRPAPSPACGGGVGRGACRSRRAMERALFGTMHSKARPMVDHPEKPNWHVSRTLRGRAKVLRRDFTEAERIVWYGLRAHRLNGASFRRQTPIGPYVVDFVCHAAKLAIEVDGGQHFEPKHIAHDMRRRAYLAAQGYRVLRFSNLDVMKNKSGVLETIAAALGNSKSPLPNPPPQAREGTEGLAR